MPRARRNDPTPIDQLFSFLTQVPAWVGPVLAVVAFAGCLWVLPFFFGLVGGAGGGDAGQMTGTFTQTISMFAVKFSPLVGGFVLVIWIAAEIRKRFDRARLDRQAGADSIAALSWHEFESLLAEAFRRRGFVVEQTGRSRPDGGVDLRLSKAGADTLVQCKHWKARRVGVKIVRELRGVVASENAHSGIVVTGGGYTAEATAFAAANPIRLIDGPELCAMIAEVRKAGGASARPSPQRGARRKPAAQAVRQSDGVRPPERPAPTRAQPRGLAPLGSPEKAAAPASPTPPPAPTAAIPPAAPVACPNCGSDMVERIAKTGKNAGSAFLGCSQFPKCRGTRAMGRAGV